MSKAMQQLMLNGQSSSLGKTRLLMEMRARRHRINQQAGEDWNDPYLKKDDGPMDDNEAAAFAVITQRMKQNLMQASALSSEQAGEVMNDWFRLLGKKGIVNAFIEDPLLMGVPYWGFVMNALLCLGLFVGTGNFNYLFFVAPLIHAVFYLYHRATCERHRTGALQKILTEGLP